jgi:hypothetical protein
MSQKFDKEGVDKAAARLRESSRGALTYDQARDRVIRAVNRQENIDRNGGK